MYELEVQHFFENDTDVCDASHTFEFGLGAKFIAFRTGEKIKVIFFGYGKEHKKVGNVNGVTRENLIGAGVVRNNSRLHNSRIRWDSPSYDIKLSTKRKPRLLSEISAVIEERLKLLGEDFSEKIRKNLEQKEGKKGET